MKRCGCYFFGFEISAFFLAFAILFAISFLLSRYFAAAARSRWGMFLNTIFVRLPTFIRVTWDLVEDVQLILDKAALYILAASLFIVFLGIVLK